MCVKLFANKYPCLHEMLHPRGGACLIKQVLGRRISIFHQNKSDKNTLKVAKAYALGTIPNLWLGRGVKVFQRGVHVPVFDKVSEVGYPFFTASLKRAGGIH